MPEFRFSFALLFTCLRPFHLAMDCRHDTMSRHAASLLINDSNIFRAGAAKRVVGLADATSGRYPRCHLSTLHDAAIDDSRELSPHAFSTTPRH